MKIRAVQLVLLLVFTVMGVFISGCASTEPDNASVRPWNSPEGWQNGALDNMTDQQHR